MNYQDNFETQVTSAAAVGATTTYLNDIPSVDAQFYLTFDPLNANGHYENVLVTSKTATSVSHAATTKAHDEGETVRMTVNADLLENFADLTSEQTFTNKTLTSPVIQSWDGWQPTSETVTYAAAQQVTVSATLAALLQKGAKFKCTNDGSTKYFYVSGVSGTTVTLAGEVDLADSAITNVYFSYADCPFGFKRGEDWYKFSAYCSTAQSIASGTDSVAIVCNVELYDINGNFNTSTGKFTAPISGYYNFNGLVAISTANALYQHIASFDNPDGVGKGRLARIYSNNGGNDLNIGGSKTFELQKGEQVWLAVYQNSGSAKALQANNSTIDGHFIGV